MANLNRARIHVRPLGATPMLRYGQQPPPNVGELLAEIARGDDLGWLVRLPSGQLAMWSGHAISTLDQRKAQQAYEQFGATRDDLDEIPRLLKAWRARAGLDQAGGALLLGVPLRTYQNWEVGRRPTYSRLLILALRAFD